MQKWRFEIEAEHPAYFWNRVILYVNHGHRELESDEHGPLLLEAGRLEPPEGCILAIGYSIMGRMTTDEPRRVASAWVEPMSANRLAVRMWTSIPEADDYVATMLADLGYVAPPTTTPSEATEQLEATEAPRVPTYPSTLARWRATWDAVCGMRKRGKPLGDMIEWLNRTHPEMAVSEKTLSDICEAGEAGLLD